MKPYCDKRGENLIQTSRVDIRLLKINVGNRTVSIMREAGTARTAEPAAFLSPIFLPRFYSDTTSGACHTRCRWHLSLLLPFVLDGVSLDALFQQGSLNSSLSASHIVLQTSSLITDISHSPSLIYAPAPLQRPTRPCRLSR